MGNSSTIRRKAFPKSFDCTVWALFVFALTIPLGVSAAEFLASSSDGVLTLIRAAPFAGCDLAAEYAVRGARLTLPFLVQLGLIWTAAYVRFEKPLLTALFAMRGLSFGLGFRLCILLGAAPNLLLAVTLHGGISVLLLFLVFRIRTDSGICSMADSLTAMMSVGGLCCALMLGGAILL